MTDLSDLKAGDKVLQFYSAWSGCRKSVEVVEKITPSGLIKVDGLLFYKNGLVRGGSNTRIERWTQEAEDEVNRMALESASRTECIIAFNKRKSKLTYEQSIAILKILKGE